MKMCIEEVEKGKLSVEMIGTPDSLFDGWINLTREFCKVLSNNENREVSLEEFLFTTMIAAVEARKEESKNVL